MALHCQYPKYEEAFMTPKKSTVIRRNIRFAKVKYGIALSCLNRATLKALTSQFGFSLELGDVILLDGSWYVTHSGLLSLATRKGCVGIRVQPVPGFCSPEQSRWAFRATAFKAASCKGFNGYGDADPRNVSAVVRGAEMRIAETRAVNRALRKAYGIGICSVEEIGSVAPHSEPATPAKKAIQADATNGHHLRDRLLVLIRQHRLDARLVKLYAADFCGTSELRHASREKIQQFVDHVAKLVNQDARLLQEKLSVYAEKSAGVA
jgi:hypothetical protein